MTWTACATGSKRAASRLSSRPRPPEPSLTPLDRVAYRRRNLIERLFGRLKNWRRIATRYDRLAQNYIAALALFAVTTEWTK